MEVVSSNPLAEEKAPSKAPSSSSSSSRSAKAAKILLGVGVIAAVGVVGYVAGTANAPTEQGPTDAAPVDDAVAQARSTVRAAYLDESNKAVTGSLTVDILEEALDLYEADPQGWSNAQLTGDLMSAFKTLRDSHRNDEGGRSLEAGVGVRGNSRMLIGEYDEELVNAAFEQCEGFPFDTTPGVVASGDDKVAIFRSNNICWVLAEPSDSGADWAKNFNLGSVDILSIQESVVAAESCGCKTETWNWCGEFNTCSVARPLGRGYRGFVEPYNDMRKEIWAKMQETCSSGDTVVLSGISRGAGVLQPLAHALAEEGLVPLDKLKLVTFGSPRALEDAASDVAHNRFETWRMVFKNDLVTSVPWGWMGYKHFGEMRCWQCSYSEGRDKPDWAWSAPDHAGYCRVFGNARCGQ